MNQAVNFFWTILCFIPVIGFWVVAGNMAYCYVFIGLSVVCMIIPARILQLSNTPKFYERLGIKTIRKFVQNGDFANRYIRKGKPAYQIVADRASAMKYMNTILMYERYHFMCFVFFLLTAVYAMMINQYAMAVLIFLANVIYNICPILLQQYNKARVKRLLR